jgi:hypothetical protein
MRTGNSDVPVFVGLWNGVGDLDRARQRLTAAGATQTVVTFAECFALLEEAIAPQIAPQPELIAATGSVAQA